MKNPDNVDKAAIGDRWKVSGSYIEMELLRKIVAAWKAGDLK